MAFTHGKDTKVYVSGYDLSTYLNSANTSMNADLAETSTFGSTYKSFVAGLVDAKISLAGFFDSGTDAIDQIMTAILGGDAYLAVIPQGDVQGTRGRGMYGVEVTYEVTTGLDGAAAISAEAQSKKGAEAIVVNTPKADKQTTGNDASGVDSGIVGGTTNSWAAFLQCFAMSGTGAPTCAVKLQDSTDNSSWLDVTDGGFTTLSAANANVPGGQRIEGAAGAALRRYTRFLWTITGTGPHFTIWAAHVRK